MTNHILNERVKVTNPGPQNTPRRHSAMR